MKTASGSLTAGARFLVCHRMDQYTWEPAYYHAAQGGISWPVSDTGDGAASGCAG